VTCSPKKLDPPCPWTDNLGGPTNTIRSLTRKNMTTDKNSEKLTPEGNIATERCPICDRLNSPGACDHCRHFFGSYWDGDVINSAGFEAFDTVWSELTSIFCDLQAEDWDFEDVRGLGRIEVLSLAWEEASSSSALVELIAFDEGPRIVTDGMLSGEGCSLYLDDFSEVVSLLEEIRNITQRLRETVAGKEGREM